MPTDIDVASPELLDSFQPAINNVVGTDITTPIFALIIGINKYNSPWIPNLYGCVADAYDVFDFLTKTLHVPPDNITLLCDEKATLETITTFLKSLVHDSRIPKGAILVIFYAGHGSRALHPLPHIGMTQILLPHDFEFGTESNAAIKNALPDFAVGQLLEEIVKKKGTNITLICDCCNSGSDPADGKVEGKERTSGIRGVNLREGAKLEVEPLRLGDDHVVIPMPHDSESPTANYLTFLVACGENQSAQEKNGRGAFTSALTTLLRSMDLTQMTSSDIIRCLPLLGSQTPDCEGHGIHRVFLYNLPSRQEEKKETLS